MGYRRKTSNAEKKNRLLCHHRAALQHSNRHDQNRKHHHQKRNHYQQRTVSEAIETDVVWPSMNEKYGLVHCNKQQRPITAFCTNRLQTDRSVAVLYGYIKSATNCFCCRFYIRAKWYLLFGKRIIHQKKRAQMTGRTKGCDESI